MITCKISGKPQKCPRVITARREDENKSNFTFHLLISVLFDCLAINIDYIILIIIFEKGIFLDVYFIIEY